MKRGASRESVALQLDPERLAFLTLEFSLTCAIGTEPTCCVMMNFEGDLVTGKNARYC